MVSRRQFIRAGFLGGAVLAAAGAWYGVSSRLPAEAGAALRADAKAVLMALIPVMLADALPEGPERPAAISATAGRVGDAVRGLAPASQKEVGELFALLALPPARFLLAGVHRSWPEATPDELSAFLQTWRFSRFALLRSGYAAIHDLIFGAWYANPESWPAIDYPGPPEVS
jgi:hypothetical protein